MAAALCMVREKQIEEALELLQETRGDRTVSYQILPEAEHFCLNGESPLELFEKFGTSYQKFLMHTLKTEKMRNACRIAAEQTPDLEHPNTVSGLASYLMGVSASDELALDVWLRSFANGQSAIRVYLTTEDPEDTTYNHAFVIYGMNDEEFGAAIEEWGTDFFELMKNLHSGVIIDPYRNCACPVNQFEDSQLAVYCKEANLTKCHTYIATPPAESAEEAEQLVAGLYDEALRVVDAAREILNSSANSSPLISTLNTVLQEIQQKKRSKKL